MKRVCILLLFLLPFLGYAQFSKKHWIPPFHGRGSNVQVEDHYIYLSTSETTPFSVTAKDGAGNPYIGSPYILSASNPIIIQIGTGQPSKMFLNLNDVNTVVSDKGVILEGTKNFYASFRVRHNSHSETLISKGKTGIGESFRVGHTINETSDNRKNFVVSVMATENNTTITLSDYDPGVIFESGLGNILDDSQTFTNVKAGESIVFSGYSNHIANIKGMLGALITSNKPIAVNTGNVLGGVQTSNADITLDQIVPVSKVGKEYIFIKGNGSATMETPIIVGTVNGTTIKINGNTIPGIVINAGGSNGFYQIPEFYYIGTGHKNMFVETSEPVYAYQSLGGGSGAHTMGLNFIPPLSCFFQKEVNIPKVNQIGNSIYSTDLMILTSTGANITINGSAIPTSQSQSVQGNTDWVTYRIPYITGDVNVSSSGPLAVGVFGYSGNAGFAGYYSGFGSTPEDTDVTICSNETQDLFELITGNPETGGTWQVPTGGTPLNGNIFDPNINIPGDYFYSFPNCDPLLPPITVKVNVIVQQSKNAGSDNAIIICSDSSPFNLFDLLGTADLGGTWSPALTSGTGIFDPAIDVSGIYTYRFESIDVCPEIAASINVTNNSLPIINVITDFEKCDDNEDGNDTNGFVKFDLTTKTSEIIGTQSGIVVTYHISEDDALRNQNSITEIYSNNKTIFVRLTNSSTGCHSVTSFLLTVNPLPIVQNAVLFQCDEDEDGFTLFNLNEANQLISTNYLNETFTFYTTKLAAETADVGFLITNPTNYNANSQIVWVRIASNKGCFSIAEIEIKVSTTNIPPTFMYNFEQCDDFEGTQGSDIDGISTFNFSNVEANLRAILPPTNQPITITFYRDLADALAENNPIIDTANYRNIGFPNTQNIYIRIDSNIDNACLGLGHHITLTVNPIPAANPVNNLILCDDISDGDDANGIVQNFDLGDQTATILGSQSPLDYTLTYHASQIEANSGANPLPLIYTNTSRDNQTIYVRILNNITGCINPHLRFNLIVNPLPIIKTPSPLPLCDDLNDDNNRNGIVQNFNLNSKNGEILNGISATQFIVTYHLSLADANNGVNSLVSPYTNSSPNNQTLFVRVTNNITGCYNTKERLQLIVNSLPTITSIPDVDLCDDATDGNDANGFRTFDLESKTATILGNQSASNFKVTYHRNQNDASSGNNPITSPFTNEQKDQQRIYIRIVNLSTGCFIADQSFNIIVKQKPVFEIDTEQIICLNNLPLTLSINTSLEPYNFNWFDANGNLLKANSTTLNITKGGKYTVTTSNTIGCDRSIDIQVKESIIATITLDNITIVDNSNNNSITINNSNQEIGIGDYEYALDHDFGPYQDEAYFEQVEAGIRTLFIRDKNNCGITSIEIPIIGNPGFFTPNGDGYNDTWQILGIKLYPKSVIYIFDRYGKVLATISPTAIGWDGTYKGKQVDSGEYWFSAQLDNGRVIKGHFSLIRR